MSWFKEKDLFLSWGSGRECISVCYVIPYTSMFPQLIFFHLKNKEAEVCHSAIGLRIPAPTNTQRRA